MACKVFSIHDTWVKGAGLGDVDDLAAIFYLAKVYRDETIVIYIVNDVDIQVGKTKFQIFNETYGNDLRSICPKLVLFGMSNNKPPSNNKSPPLTLTKIVGSQNTNLDEPNVQLESYLKGAETVIICAPINDRDSNLCDLLNNLGEGEIHNLKGQGVIGATPPPYNFNNSCKLKLTPCDANKKGKVGNNEIQCYGTDESNRRFDYETLGKIVGEKNIETMRKYAIMKVLFLPPANFAMGLVVSKKELEADGEQNMTGTGTGNNLTGLLIYNPPPDLEVPIPPIRPNEIIKQHIDQNKFNVDATLESYPFINEYYKLMKDEVVPGASKECHLRFKRAMAYIASSLSKFTQKPIDKAHTLATFSNDAGLYNSLIVDSIEISSPMWDLIAVHAMITGTPLDKPADANKMVESDIRSKILSKIRSNIEVANIMGRMYLSNSKSRIKSRSSNAKRPATVTRSNARSNLGYNSKKSTKNTPRGTSFGGSRKNKRKNTYRKKRRVTKKH